MFIYVSSLFIHIARADPSQDHPQRPSTVSHRTDNDR